VRLKNQQLSNVRQTKSLFSSLNILYHQILFLKSILTSKNLDKIEKLNERNALQFITDRYVKKQNEYTDLVAEFYKKQQQLSEDLRMTKLENNKPDRKFFHPTDAKLVRVFYLGYSRNAWHSTWVSYYNPGDIAFELLPLKKRAENLRTPGSQFWIEIRDALWLKFEKSNALILEINTTSDYNYQELLASVEENDLKIFWAKCKFIPSNWLLFFEIGTWKPDLISKKKPIRYESYIQKNGKNLGWKKHETDIIPFFRNFAEQLSIKVGTGQLL